MTFRDKVFSSRFPTNTIKILGDVTALKAALKWDRFCLRVSLLPVFSDQVGIPICFFFCGGRKPENRRIANTAPERIRLSLLTPFHYYRRLIFPIKMSVFLAPLHPKGPKTFENWSICCNLAGTKRKRSQNKYAHILFKKLAIIYVRTWLTAVLDKYS